MSGIWTPQGTIPTPDANDDGVDARIELYDSDLLVIEGVFNYINANIVGRARSVDATEREIIERFALAGFKVSIVWYEMLDAKGTFSPKIIIEDRIDVPTEGFDHERQTWEVQHDILGIDATPGAMQIDGTVKTPTHHTAFIDGASKKG